MGMTNPTIFPDNRRGDEAGTTNRAELDADFGRGDHIFLDRTRIDVPVYVVIPNAVGEALRMLPNSKGRSF
jgi:hypothetical protein